MKQQTLRHEFVELIPDDVKEGVLYISIRYATAVHKCCCGCGQEVVTPIKPSGWKLIFDGESVSLHPSVGNWSFKCKSHYWIADNRVKWAAAWSKRQIQAARAGDRAAQQRHFDGLTPGRDAGNLEGTAEMAKDGADIWQRLRRWWESIPK